MSEKMTENKERKEKDSCPKCNSVDIDNGLLKDGKPVFYCYNCHYEEGFKD